MCATRVAGTELVCILRPNLLTDYAAQRRLITILDVVRHVTASAIKIYHLIAPMLLFCARTELQNAPKCSARSSTQFEPNCDAIFRLSNVHTAAVHSCFVTALSGSGSGAHTSANSTLYFPADSIGASIFVGFREASADAGARSPGRSFCALFPFHGGIVSPFYGLG